MGAVSGHAPDLYKSTGAKHRQSQIREIQTTRCRSINCVTADRISSVWLSWAGRLDRKICIAGKTFYWIECTRVNVATVCIIFKIQLLFWFLWFTVAESSLANLLFVVWSYLYIRSFESRFRLYWIKTKLRTGVATVQWTVARTLLTQSCLN